MIFLYLIAVSKDVIIQDLKVKYENLLEKYENTQQKTDERLSIVEGLSSTRKILRTCEELGSNGVNTSGTYLIDPDGQDIGEKPITVFCHFTNDGKSITKLLHDYGTPITVEQCNSLHCFKHQFDYSGTPTSQIKALTELSEHCEQKIDFGCYSAPLEDDGTIYGGWKDIKGTY